MGEGDRRVVALRSVARTLGLVTSTSRRAGRWAAPAVSLALLAGCGGDDAPAAAPDGDGTTSTSTTAEPSPTTTTSTTPPPPPTTTTSTLPPRPDWLGTRPLPLRPDGFGEIQPTPPELVDRRISTVDVLPPPAGEAFESSIVEVPEDVAARSTWDPECPVALGDLRYVRVSFWGFDGTPHTGELLVNESAAQPMVDVFAALHAARFPVEEMRVTRKDELDAAPTGDGNNTSAFVCRPTRGSKRWSEHAFGLAVDVNPFHNPYTRDDLVLPELASAYVDRENVRPGMILPGDVVTGAFAGIGWGWGGAWQRPVDRQHFSANDR